MKKKLKNEFFAALESRAKEKVSETLMAHIRRKFETIALEKCFLDLPQTNLGLYKAIVKNMGESARRAAMYEDMKPTTKVGKAPGRRKI